MKLAVLVFIAFSLVSTVFGVTNTRTRPTTIRPVTTQRPHLTSNRKLSQISSQLYSADVNSAGNDIVLNFQGQTVFGNRSDRAPAPLFEKVSPELLNRPIYAAMLQLYNNYIAAADKAETVTAEERNEENTFIGLVANTEVMRTTYQFLKTQGEFNGTAKQFKTALYDMWFGMYPRVKNKLGSSGFEHVFLGELKNDGVTGLHSWLRYYLEEKNGNMNYLGYIRKRVLARNTLIELPISWLGVYKPINSILVGSSPELEMALYTICFLARRDNWCPLEANGVRYRIKSFGSHYQGKRLIGTAFPSL